jgi:hypothetical protein
VSSPQRANQAPIHVTTHPLKPSAKKLKTHSSAFSTILEPPLSIQNNAELIEISDKKDEKEQEDDIENNNTEEDIEDNDAKEEEGEEEETMPFKFKTT